MRKVLAIISAAVMMMSVTACGSSAPGNSTGSSSAQWPKGTVTITVPAKAGGGTDVLVRRFAQAMQDATGGTFVVVNDDSGNGTVAAEKVRNAKPDGTNLLIANTGLCGIIASGQYEHTFEEFADAGLMTTPSTEGAAIFVPGDSQFETFEDFVKYSQENPGKLVAGVQANGAAHFTTILLQNQLGTSYTIVDCGGNADRTTALMGHSIDFSIMNITGEDQYVKSGDLRVLCSLSEYQSELLPELKPIKEYGYEPIDLAMCAMVLLPKDTDPAIVQEVSNALKKCSEDTNLLEDYKKLGAAFEYKTSEESTEFVNSIQKMYNDAYAEMDK